MLKKILLALVVMVFFAGNANAWYIEIDSSELYGGALPSTSFSFNYEAGDAPIVLDNVFLALESSTGASLYGGLPVAVQPHTAGIFNASVWGSTGVTPLKVGNTVYNISAYNPHATLDYIPLDDGEPLLMTAIWASDPGVVTLTNYNPGIEFVSIMVAGVDLFYGVDIFISEDGQRIGPNEGGSVIPIPGAIYLMASGLIGLVGLRRRMR